MTVFPAKFFNCIPDKATYVLVRIKVALSEHRRIWRERLPYYGLILVQMPNHNPEDICANISHNCRQMQNPCSEIGGKASHTYRLILHVQMAVTIVDICKILSQK